MARRVMGQTKKYSLPDQVKVNTPEKEKKFKQKKYRERVEAMGGKVKYAEEFKKAERPSSTKGNILHGKLKSQKELKTITDSKKYKDSSYNKKNKMLNVATMAKGGRASLKGGGRAYGKNS